MAKSKITKSEKAAALDKPNAPDERKPIDSLDRIFHEKARLSILTFVVAQEEGINFNDLKQKCDLTDGNLNRHLKVLTDANILRVDKTGRGRATRSIYFLTDVGRSAFENYLDALETVVRNAQAAAGKISNVQIVPE